MYTAFVCIYMYILERIYVYCISLYIYYDVARMYALVEAKE